ncbi:hypothetical protein BBK36DRAFT_16478 [Trichoderma citrinoviride]|uniref:Uncharacterized protein n=1 Tax=Trichoderma citrinoviride TaxID=58853 RepID=A0A2T4BNF4_9HYPO|nr:hypothetical protein BBK36DRAFT_16478 [Trichoderma citrinoviride]PTB70853.1 hypothetical protein BBK36DRAFT_16478 [Trichoderma citrinoviride]
MSLYNRRPSAIPDLEAAMPDPKAAGEVIYDGVFVDVGSRGYDIQSRILGIPDHLGLFQRGAPGRNGFLGMLIVSFFGAFIWSLVGFMFYVVWLLLVAQPMGPAAAAMVYGFMLGFLFLAALTMTGLDNVDRRWRRRQLLLKMEKEVRERNGRGVV